MRKTATALMVMCVILGGCSKEEAPVITAQADPDPVVVLASEEAKPVLDQVLGNEIAVVVFYRGNW